MVQLCSSATLLTPLFSKCGFYYYASGYSRFHTEIEQFAEEREGPSSHRPPRKSKGTFLEFHTDFLPHSTGQNCGILGKETTTGMVT